ncbi:MAG: hypothetical protein KTR30_30335 [Saprospiraceae bacterium]|nr:hypothetical protein [Saprospiraceae bacterium]
MSNNIRLGIALICCFFAGNTCAQTAREVLTKSIAYHDPKGVWESGNFKLKLKESRPNGTSRETEITLDNGQQSFELSQLRDGRKVYRFVKGDECQNQLDGSNDFSAEEKKKFRLDCEYSPRMKDYYTYLYGLPMKLRDPGTILGEEVKTVDFDGRQLLQLRVTYQPEVGKDIWYFYFDPSTYALSGYRFYHDESKNDGEYILISGEQKIGPLKLPKKREWYTHQEEKFLGTDELVK